MLHTIYAAKFEQTIIHQHVHLRRECQSHAPAHVLMILYPIDKSLICLLTKRKKDIMLELGIYMKLISFRLTNQTKVIMIE